MTTPSGREHGRRSREERSQRAVTAALALVREKGLRVEEPAVLNDLFSLMDREIAVTAYLSEQGAPVVAPSRELPPGPHEHDGFWVSFWTHVEPDPDPDHRQLLGHAGRPARWTAVIPGRAADALCRRHPARAGVAR